MVKKWQLTINFEKSHVVHFGKKIYFLIIALIILPFKLAFVKKNFGVLFDSNFSFRKHIFQCVSKARECAI